MELEKNRLHKTFGELPLSILNTARDHVEGRNLLIHILSKSSRVSEQTVIHWIREQKIEVKGLDEYVIKNKLHA